MGVTKPSRLSWAVQATCTLRTRDYTVTGQDGTTFALNSTFCDADNDVVVTEVASNGVGAILIFKGGPEVDRNRTADDPACSWYKSLTYGIVVQASTSGQGLLVTTVLRVRWCSRQQRNPLVSYLRPLNSVALVVGINRQCVRGRAGSSFPRA